MNKFSIKRTFLYCLGGIFIVACSETSEENIGELAQNYATSGNKCHRQERQRILLGQCFNTDTPAPYNDNAESTRTNYRYLLKYATFTKH